MAPTHALPVFREMDEEECTKLLERNHVGRMAHTFNDRVGITPLNYIYSDGSVYGRTGPWYTIRPGSKQTALLHNPWIAFEVDEVDDLFSWRSVVLQGAFYPLLPDYPQDRKHRERAIELLRTLVPGTFREDDPAPLRDLLFRIEIQEMNGREARPATNDESNDHAEKG